MKALPWLLLALASTAPGDDTIYLDRTVISGNPALPRVLYIQPWEAFPEQPVPAGELSVEAWPRPGHLYPHQYRRELRLRAGGASNESPYMDDKE